MQNTEVVKKFSYLRIIFFSIFFQLVQRQYFHRHLDVETGWGFEMCNQYRRRCTGLLVISEPFSNTEPESGITNPAMRFRIVVLPLPVGPTITNVSLVSTRMSNGPSIKPGNFLVIPTSSRVNPIFPPFEPLRRLEVLL